MNVDGQEIWPIDCSGLRYEHPSSFDNCDRECIDELKPVCASDMETYQNHCVFQVAQCLAEMKKTRTRGNRQPNDQIKVVYEGACRMSKCQYWNYESRYQSPGFSPLQCETNGLYSAKQCYSAWYDECWCVDQRTGEEIINNCNKTEEEQIEEANHFQEIFNVGELDNKVSLDPRQQNKKQINCDQGAACPEGVQRVKCSVDPCEGATCEKYPAAACVGNMCGGWCAEFFLFGVSLDC